MSRAFRLSCLLLVAGMTMSFAAASHAQQTPAAAPAPTSPTLAGSRTFEMRTYYANPGKIEDLHKRFREKRAHRAVRAKTGTLDDAIALSGYVLAPGGKNTIVFSIMFNRVSGRAAAARHAADKLVDMIYDRQWK